MTNRLWRHQTARYAAPVAFLAAVTVAVLLVRAGLHAGRPATGTVGTKPSAPARPAATAKPPKRPAGAGAPRPVARPQPQPSYYSVGQGDTFSTIATRFSTTVQALQALNPGVSSNALTLGQRIRVR